MRIDFVDYHHPNDGIIAQAETDILPPIASFLELDSGNYKVTKIGFHIDNRLKLKARIYVWTD